MSLASKAINGIMNLKPSVMLTKPNAPAAAATIAVISNITKDALNCYYYVNQSLHNERMPEDKRKFVAGLDLSNGILNVVTQAVIGKQVSSFANKYFDNHIAKKHFSPEVYKKMFKEITTKETFETFVSKMNKSKKYAKVGLSVISALVGTQIIAKRIIVPFLATPMASYFRAKFEKTEKRKQQQDTICFSNNQTIPRHRKPANCPNCFQSFMK